MTTTKTLTVGELTGALARVPMHTPITIYATLSLGLDEDDKRRERVDFSGELKALHVRTHLNGVTIEAEE